MFRLNHNEAVAVLRLFADAYKTGLMDAEWINDIGRCYEHIKSTSEVGVYGRVTEQRFDSWREWMHRVLLMGDIRYTRVRAVDVVNRIKKKHLIDGCLLPLAQDFYNQGVQDWLDAPVSRSFERLTKCYYPRWTRQGIHKRTMKEMWIDMQRFAFERSKQYEGAEPIRSLTPRKFEIFSLTLWTALNERAEREYLLNNGR